MGAGACGGSHYPAGSPVGAGRAFATVLEGWDRAQTIAILNAGEAVTPPTSPMPAARRGASWIADRRRVRWAAPDGREIEGFLTLPRGDGPFPTILHVHGGPIWAFQDRPPGSVELGPDRPRLRDLRAKRARLRRAVAASSRPWSSATWAATTSLDMLAGPRPCWSREGLADPERLGIMGVSYGGFMACWLPTQDARFRAAVAGLAGLRLVRRALREQSRRMGRRVPRRRATAVGRAVLRSQPRALRAQRPHPHAAHRGRARPRDAARPGDRVPQRARGAERRERRGRLSRRGPRRATTSRP